jgi:hypothetical protein
MLDDLDSIDNSDILGSLWSYKVNKPDLGIYTPLLVGSGIILRIVIPLSHVVASTINLHLIWRTCSFSPWRKSWLKGYTCPISAVSRRSQSSCRYLKYWEVDAWTMKKAGRGSKSKNRCPEKYRLVLSSRTQSVKMALMVRLWANWSNPSEDRFAWNISAGEIFDEVGRQRTYMQTTGDAISLYLLVASGLF